MDVQDKVSFILSHLIKKFLRLSGDVYTSGRPFESSAVNGKLVPRNKKG